MQDQFWVELLRRIPATFHESLILATVTGADIVMQSIIQLDEHFLVLRGRPAGTSDNGRLMILPYNQINYLFFPAKMTEPQMKAIFGSGDLVFAPLPVTAPAPTAITEAEEPPVEEPTTTATVTPAANSTPAATPASAPVHSKAMLLSKLRAKLAGDGHKGGRN